METFAEGDVEAVVLPIGVDPISAWSQVALRCRRTTPGGPPHAQLRQRQVRFAVRRDPHEVLLETAPEYGEWITHDDLSARIQAAIGVTTK